MFIAGVGTAVPGTKYSQRDCWDALQDSAIFQTLAPRSKAILRKVLTGQNGITSRHLALEDLADAFDLTPDILHRRFSQHAPELATQAARTALENAHCRAEDIDAVLVSTCTGYLCPGLTSYVAERLSLPMAVLCLDFVGQGCGAALPNLRTAQSLLASGACRRVLSVCVEVCSAAFYLDDDPGVLISACIFGDGAGAAVLSNEANGNRPLRWNSCSSRISPTDRNLLRFEQNQGMLRNILAPQVPKTAATHVSRLLQQALEAQNLDSTAISTWILHPGGRDILLAIRDITGIPDRELQWSEMVLREYGNLSSASVFFVLKSALQGGAPGGRWWMSSFGAGFSCHGALLEVD